MILRATRDYAGRLDEFLAWTTGVSNLLNAPAIVAWNADRRYLGDLARHGVPTVPGEVVAPGERAGLPRAGPVFVSPTIGTGTRRCEDPSAATAYIAELHTAGQSIWVQPTDPAPETVLIFLGGEPSHAARKKPILAPDEVAPTIEGGLGVAKAMLDEDLVECSKLEANGEASRTKTLSAPQKATIGYSIELWVDVDHNANFSEGLNYAYHNVDAGDPT